MAGINGVKISAKTAIARWTGWRFCLAATLLCSLDTPSTPDTATKSL